MSDLVTKKLGIDAFVVGEALVQSEFEPKVYPFSYFDESIHETNLEWMKYKGRVFRDFLSRLKEIIKNKQADIPDGYKYTHVLLLPWLKMGGADKAALLFANSICMSDDTRVLVLTTEPTDSPWADRLDPRVHLFDFGNFSAAKTGDLTNPISFYEQRELLFQFFLSNPPDHIHVINSHVGWFLLGKYGRILKSASKLYVSLYCYDYAEDGEPVGYARYIRTIAPFLQAIVSDNTKFPDFLCDRFGIEKALFRTVWHSVGGHTTEIKLFRFIPKSKNLLWASRIDRQKRPDVLYEIATLMPEFNFHIYGDSVMDSQYATHHLTRLKSLANVHFHKSYRSIDELNVRPYTAFLYTSEWDGLPNILLEVGQRGVPIIAPDQGGVPDLIGEDTGYLVQQVDRVQDYIDAIHSIVTDGNSALRKTLRCRELIAKRHSDENFVKMVNSCYT